MIQNTVYHGEQKNNTFERYVTIHKEKHKVLVNLEENGSKIINERSNVWYIIAGINYGALKSVKNAILASATYSQDFDACVTL